MLRKITTALAIFAATASAFAASAEVLEFEADDEVRLIRCLSVWDDAATCELIHEGDLLYTCLALDEAGEPIAAANLVGTMASVDFHDIQPEEIADVKCRLGG